MDTIDVRLEDADGKFVAGADIPFMRPLPEVVTWGLRVFKIHEVPQYTGSSDHQVFVYREIVYFPIPVKNVRQ